jgi:dienelactone hydrolase
MTAKDFWVTLLPMKRFVALTIAAMLTATAMFAQEALPANARLVSFAGPSGTLHGFFYVPEGKGPFAAVLWNHGSEKLPGAQPELAEFYTSRGFVFFLPHRSGQGRSPGIYIPDEIRRNRADPSAAVRSHQIANEDIVSALAWLRAQPEIDPGRIIVSGCSFGGIQTLLTAEKGLGVRAFIAFAPAAKSWGNGELQTRLEDAVRKAKAPVFILQAKNDFDTGPTKVLGKIAKANGGQAEIYPAFGKTAPDGHWAFATSKAGIEVWQKDVLEFIHAALGKPVSP